MVKVEIIKAKKNGDYDFSIIHKKKVCGYARVSTDSDEQLTSYKSQIKHYTSLIKSNQNWIFVGMYADEGISGTQVKNRKQFKKMIEDAMNGKIDMIIAKSISRFARNTIDTLKYVRELRDKKVDVFFEKENIHTLTLDSEMFLTLYSAFAQAESESTSQNVKMGLKAKMKQGGYCGQPDPFGYYWNKEAKKLEINEKEAATVKLIFDLYEKGLGCMRISKKLNEMGLKPRKVNKWDSNKILRVIKNEKYVGDVLGQKYYVDDPMTHKKKINFGEKEQYYARDVHTAIISRELWDNCQEIYKKRSNKYAKQKKSHNTKYSLKYPFSSKLECGCCRDNYTRRLGGKSGKDSNRQVYWRCSNIINGKKECIAKESIREVYLKDMFTFIFNSLSSQIIRNNFHLINIIRSILNNDENKNTLERLYEKRQNYEVKLSHLIDLKLEDFDNVKIYESKEKELNIKLKCVNEEIENLLKNKGNSNNIEKRLTQIEKLLSSNITIDEFDEDLFKLLVKKIIIGKYNESGTFNQNIINFVLNSGGNINTSFHMDKYDIRFVSNCSKERTCSCMAIFGSKIYYA